MSVTGGTARRLTSHPAEETTPRFSPDGHTLSFAANYEGANEVYTMPAEGGLPLRRTLGGGAPAGWTPDGELLVVTNGYSSLPVDQKLVAIDPDNSIQAIPLNQAAQGVYDDAKAARPNATREVPLKIFGSFPGNSEAIPLTSNHAGTSRDQMYWKSCVYFASDRDGTMNIWSMDENGKGLKQHTRHEGWDVECPLLSVGLSARRRSSPAGDWFRQ